MQIRVTSNVHLKAPGRVKMQRYLADRVWMRCDPYVPMSSGVLKNNVSINLDGGMLTYNGPYAHYQYVGQVMGPNIKTKRGWRSMAKKGGKHYTGRAISYSGAPMRGSYWDKRMMADHRGDLVQDMQAYVAREMSK